VVTTREEIVVFLIRHAEAIRDLTDGEWSRTPNIWDRGAKYVEHLTASASSDKRDDHLDGWTGGRRMTSFQACLGNIARPFRGRGFVSFVIANMMVGTLLHTSDKRLRADFVG
jgi:ribosomal protein S19